MIAASIDPTETDSTGVNPVDRVDPTFRDPAGSLKLENDQAIRTIYAEARAEVIAFLGSGLCARLEQSGDMISSAVEDGPAGLRLVHPRVRVVSFPWEWTLSQWLAAGELTLRLCEEGLGDGWILKDATPLNILFVGTQPVLVDVLSFERYQPGRALWLAYGQYVRTMLLPLVMHKLNGWPLSLSFFRRDGYEPAELYRVLRWLQRMSPDAFWPITLPAWMERKGGKGGAKNAASTMEPDAAMHGLRRTLAGLRKRTRRAAGAGRSSEWSRYAGALTHYSEDENAAKRKWVEQVIDVTRPARVLDVGANTGEYSALVAGLGVEVVALERDAEAADRLYAMSREKKLSILTICADLARPTPAAGWNNREYSPLLERLQGRFEMVMMLAVIHHLLLLEQIPLHSIVDLAARLTTRWLVVEWVPVTDPMFQSLMRGRDALYGGLMEAHLLDACAGRFCVRERLVLGNGRVLMLLEKEPGC